jgi:hypothetical protein
MELFCEKVKDLLRPGNDNLKIAETPEEGVHVPDATQGGTTCRSRFVCTSLGLSIVLDTGQESDNFTPCSPL